MDRAGRAKMKIRLGRDLIKSGNYSCPLCRIVIRFKWCSIDHIIPRCRGGGDNKENLQLVHFECNSRKGGDLPKGYSHIQYPRLDLPPL